VGGDVRDELGRIVIGSSSGAFFLVLFPFEKDVVSREVVDEFDDEEFNALHVSDGCDEMGLVEGEGGGGGECHSLTHSPPLLLDKQRNL